MHANVNTQAMNCEPFSGIKCEPNLYIRMQNGRARMQMLAMRHANVTCRLSHVNQQPIKCQPYRLANVNSTIRSRPIRDQGCTQKNRDLSSNSMGLSLSLRTYPVPGTSQTSAVYSSGQTYSDGFTNRSVWYSDGFTYRSVWYSDGFKYRSVWFKFG